MCTTHPHTPTGVVSFSNSAQDWSDGFRLVRQSKYGSNEGLSSRYKSVVAVGGLIDKKQLWPQALTDFLEVRGRERGRECLGGDGWEG